MVPENRYPVSKSFLDSITSRGFEVNVHDLKHDGRLYADHEEFLRRAKRINNYAREYGAQGFRSGILYRNADWYGAFEFSYDMSLPNVAHLDPQRGGCCTVMPFFIGEDRRASADVHAGLHAFSTFWMTTRSSYGRRQIALVREEPRADQLSSFIRITSWSGGRRKRTRPYSAIWPG